MWHACIHVHMHVHAHVSQMLLSCNHMLSQNTTICVHCRNYIVCHKTHTRKRKNQQLNIAPTTHVLTLPSYNPLAQTATLHSLPYIPQMLHTESKLTKSVYVVLWIVSCSFTIVIFPIYLLVCKMHLFFNYHSNMIFIYN